MMSWSGVPWSDFAFFVACLLLFWAAMLAPAAWRRAFHPARRRRRARTWRRLKLELHRWWHGGRLK